MLSHPIPDSERVPIPFPTSCTDPWTCSHCHMCPCCWIFPASPHPRFPQGCPPTLTLPSPTQLQELLWGIGDGMFLVSSQLGSLGNPGSGRKNWLHFHVLVVICITYMKSQILRFSPTLTPNWPPNYSGILFVETTPLRLDELTFSLLQLLVWHRPT